jgi:hypothetical protein
MFFHLNKTHQRSLEGKEQDCEKDSADKHRYRKGIVQFLPVAGLGEAEKTGF